MRGREERPLTRSNWLRLFDRAAAEMASGYEGRVLNLVGSTTFYVEQRRDASYLMSRKRSTGGGFQYGEAQVKFRGKRNKGAAQLFRERPPKTNWEQHAAAFENSCQHKFLSSNFFYSLPKQKPGPKLGEEEMLSTRPMKWNFQRNERLLSTHFEKAWRALLHSQVKSKKYLRPGITAPIENHKVNDIDAKDFKSCSTSEGPVNYQRARMSLYKNVSSLQNIDLDQIVMEHYQAVSTPQGAVSKHVQSPFSFERNSTACNANSWPKELCEKCRHGFKLALCPDASSHLQELKDQLITIANELLDNVGELSPKKLENLHQERLLLNKQIQLLEKHLQYLAQHQQRESSHVVSLHTPAQHFQMDTSLHRFSSDNMVHRQNEYAPMDREVFTPKLLEVQYIEGSGDKRWRSADFTWANKLETYNRKVFGNHSFRPNQREVINATMSGHDVFVLMPTGGGKSLTYQLPALISPGITLVVSPLVSLIQDQIMHLLQANIPFAYLSANMEWVQQQEILRELLSDACKYKLLYVYPEKVAKSDILLRQLDALYSRESLARIVIDEAHCVSQWGHDFRPDYQGLGILKQKYPATPVLALTATATASVKEEDVVQALGLKNCIIFRQSFNRSNLWYSVVPKTKKCLDDIDNFIKENHFDECGIIYCLSRMDCEKVAEKLQECGHKASFYHGSMDPRQRSFVQQQWSKDEVNIICATVAFGMGINKPDVRFVIHHSLPKSIEGYHQECGRAGRDGLRSSCVLYYNYSDYIRVKAMLGQGVADQSAYTPGSRRNVVSTTDRILETNIENLLCMVNYCENDSECRRLLQLIHFGEKFNASDCQKTCDNCSKMLNSVARNVSGIARQLVDLVKLTGPQYSMAHIMEVYRGSLSMNVKKYRHDTLSLHGAGKHMPKGEASRILRHLVIKDILVEDVKKSDLYGTVSSILRINESKACKLYSGEQEIILRFCTTAKSSKSKLEFAPSEPSCFTTMSSAPNTTVQMQNAADLNLSAKLYAALRMLRTTLVKEAGEGVMAYHIFGNATLQQISKRIPRTKDELLEISGIGKAKLHKYGDRVLETIESIIREQRQGCKNSSSNSDSDTTKRRRSSLSMASLAKDDYFDESTIQSKKRVTMVGNDGKLMPDALNILSYNDRLIDLELDGYDDIEEEHLIQ
ncbi:hypothetical protein HPP92_004440 [Vanilla planifolia]|uniref:DNA 3'-5' helicase n=1 Tax=Vanilla planifolia TaxID=51239 RepID=A0A835VGE9_VANPL|nr:hypothetical protein HPP92_004440 [Vanilla planifolia]